MSYTHRFSGTPSSWGLWVGWFIVWSCAYGVVLRSAAIAQKPQGHAQTGLATQARRPYRTLAGIYTGKTYVMTNPTNGVIEEAVVIRTAPQTEHHLPLVWLRFPDGTVVRYAADRVQLLNRSIDEMEYLQMIHRDVQDAIRDRLRMDVSRVPIVVLDGRNWASDPALPNRVLGPFMTEWFRRGDNYEPLRKGVFLPGFAHSGRAVVHRGEGAFDEKTVTHQLVHVLSASFRKQAITADCNPLVEGITEYFTYQVATPNWGRTPDPKEISYGPLKTAQPLIAQIGEERMKALFFDRGHHSFDDLRKLLDKQKPGRLMEICAQLDRAEHRFKTSDSTGPTLP
jgi:hypothetical protein